MRTSRALLTLPALVLALVLAGCGDDDSASDSTAESTSGSTSGSTPSGSPATADDAGAVDGTVVTDLVSFEAPEGWRVVTPEDAQAMTSGDAIEEGGADFLEQTGVTADQLVQLIGQADALALSDEGRVGGFFDNINVITQPGAPAPVEVLAQQLGQIGATLEDSSTEQVAGQETLVASYVLPVGEVEVQGRALQVPVGDQTVVVTVSAREAATADAALDGVVASLATTG